MFLMYAQTMKNSTTISYCSGLVKASDYDRFLQGLFVPAAQREVLWALLALNIELAHIHHKITEPMIGHIRFAWWRENIEALYRGEAPRQHPVIEALASVIPDMPQERLMKLIESYQIAFPQVPDTQIMDDIIAGYLPSVEGWRRAGGIIARHRQRFGAGKNGWLYIKLLLAGF